MNAIEFIENLVTQNRIKDFSAANAFDLFRQNGGEGTFAYFRTKFNNRRKELGINEVTTIEIPETPVMLEESPVIINNLATRVIKNYKNGDKMPEIPGLISTGTLFDRIISDRLTSPKSIEEYKEKFGEDMPEDMLEIGGFTRKCVDIVAGKPGSGKTYSRNILAAKAKIFMKREYNIDIRVGFISAEMRESEWAKELQQCELLKEIEVDYMLNYVGCSNYEDIFWEAFGDYDIVIVDSFPAVISHIKMSPNERRTDKIIVFDFIRKALDSVEKHNNNVQLINQANKDGDYKGGTELPHMMSSMSFVGTEGTARYMQFIKNRNNGTTINRKVYFSKDAHGDIVFNEESYVATYEQILDKKQSLADIFNTLDRERMNGVGKISENEMGPQEILNESIPAHLREEPGPGHQVDLEESIAAIEAERRENV
jgi:hypothetical protein